MKKEFKKMSLELVSKAVLKSAEKEVNSACFFIGYQPQLPKDILKLKKI